MIMTSVMSVNDTGPPLRSKEHGVCADDYDISLNLAFAAAPHNI